ncbi:MAG: hypothetical protein QXE45_04485 [Thermoplasmata archaeon]
MPELAPSNYLSALLRGILLGPDIEDLPSDWEKRTILERVTSPEGIRNLVGAASLALPLASLLPRIARAGFFKRVYHGTAAPVDFRVFRVRPDDVGVHVTPHPEISSDIAMRKATSPLTMPGPRVLPLQARIRNPYEVYADLTAWYDPSDYAAVVRGVNPGIGESELVGIMPKNIPKAPAAQRHVASVMLHKMKQARKAKEGRSLEPEEAADIVRDVLNRFGYDALAYPNYWEARTSDPRMWALSLPRSWAVLNPKNLRSRFAQFRDLESEDLLASLVPVSLAGLMMRERGPQ